QFMTGGEPDDQIEPIRPGTKCTWNNQTSIQRTRKGGNSTLDLARVARVQRADLYPQRGGYRLNCGKLTDSAAPNKTQSRSSRHTRRYLLQLMAAGASAKVVSMTGKAPALPSASTRAADGCSATTTTGPSAAMSPPAGSKWLRTLSVCC